LFFAISKLHLINFTIAFYFNFQSFRKRINNRDTHNSVDEAVAGHASSIEVTLYKDGSIKVQDDGRGMPVDMHPEQNMPGVEVILTQLHAGGKFSNKNC
jgi:hypothetical protein